MKLPALSSLNLGIGAAVAWIAECYEVAWVVSFFVSLQPKQAKRLDMMDALTGTTTTLTGVIIAFQRLAPLRLPVRPAILCATVDILRMIQAVAMCITTWARAVFTAAFTRFQNAFIYPEGSIAIKAGEVLHFSTRRARFERSILTLTRTVFTTTILYAGCPAVKLFAAVLT